ncbi:MAG: hypothetical protein ACW986_19400 [Promethearchaeota archaeon]|jgi:hypothetical protein
MTIIYSAEGFFREGEVGENWEFEMELGKIILTDQELTLMKKSDISLTEVGTPIDNYTDGFKVPLPGIRFHCYCGNTGWIFIYHYNG